MKARLRWLLKRAVLPLAVLAVIVGAAYWYLFTDIAYAEVSVPKGVYQAVVTFRQEMPPKCEDLASAWHALIFDGDTLNREQYDAYNEQAWVSVRCRVSRLSF